jgi:excisionase family DNA binding protein
MKTWMTVQDLSEYLQIPESKIRQLIKKKQIPFHDNHGFLRFYQPEIDEWMKLFTTSSGNPPSKEGEDSFPYRGKPIKDYKLTAALVLLGATQWNRLPEFIKKTVEKTNEVGRDYLYREEFRPFMKNFNDYLRISCQLGLVDNSKGDERDERRKRYYPTEYSRRIYSQENSAEIKKIILESILYIVKNKMETTPEERHSILLLWYLLKLKEEGKEPEEHHFRLEKDKPNSYYPRIRLNFTESLRSFLFEGDKEKAKKFLNEWERLL